MSKDAIEWHLRPENNRDEFESDGLKIMKSKEFTQNLLTEAYSIKTKRGGFDILDENNDVIASGSNKGMTIFSKRAILRMGMLLRDSPVAKEIRTKLLNALESKSGQKAISEEVQKITEEQQMMLNIIMSNDEELALNLRTYKKYKDNIIIELETEVKEKEIIITDLEEKIEEESKLANVMRASVGSKSMEEMSKILASQGAVSPTGKPIGRNGLFAWCYENKIIQKRNRLPYQPYIDNGVFEIVTQSYTNSKGEIKTSPTIRVTVKGIDWFIKNYK